MGEEFKITIFPQKLLPKILPIDSDLFDIKHAMYLIRDT